MPPVGPDTCDRIRESTFVAAVEWHDTIASTNDRGNELARGGPLDTPFLILAGRQTAGRGRGANRWWSGEGALTFSVVFDPQHDAAERGRPPLPLEVWPRIALVAGVALCDVLETRVPDFPCRLKWPNDVLLNGRKVAGILAEITAAPTSGTRRLILGVGINVNNSLTGAPAEISAAAAALCDLAARPFDSSELLIDWLNRFETHLAALGASDARLPERWQGLCALTGRSIELLAGNRTVRGLCRGIDTDGALLVETADGVEPLYAGTLVRVTQ